MEAITLRRADDAYIRFKDGETVVLEISAYVVDALLATTQRQTSTNPAHWLPPFITSLSALASAQISPDWGLQIAYAATEKVRRLSGELNPTVGSQSSTE